MQEDYYIYELCTNKQNSTISQEVEKRVSREHGQYPLGRFRCILNISLYFFDNMC
jgi:hypothetical protein